MRVALVHDWLIHMRGGEKVLEALAEIFPAATLYTLFYRREQISPSLQRMKIKSSFLQFIPGICKFYRWLLPLMPWVVQTLQIEDVDLVISSSHCVAKGVRLPNPNVKHICYCHTPMRYLWGFEEDYFGKTPFFLRPVLKWLLGRLRHWDLESNKQVDYFVANSQNVRQRVQNFYGRDAEVVYPPLDTDQFYFHKNTAKEDYYLVVSAFVPYKRVDLVIEAFNQLDRKLLIVGSGPLAAHYERLRKRESIFFSGPVTDSKLRDLYAGARALIFPTEEDFGIVPLEAQACGTPVIAYGKGGALEGVQTGLFFYEQTPAAIMKAVYEFEKKTFDLNKIPEGVVPFGKSRFKEQMLNFITRVTQQPDYAVR